MLDPHGRTWTYASAGHVPAVLRHKDRTAVLLDEQADAPLGIDGPFHAVRVELEEGDTLVLYTDGLIERRSESITVGLERLVGVCSDAPAEPGEMCDYVLDTLVAEDPGDDDIALLAVTLD